MLKLAIFANQLLILALEFPLVSHARTAGAIGILGYLTSAGKLPGTADLVPHSGGMSRFHGRRLGPW
jgi:hypothetical protein